MTKSIEIRRTNHWWREDDKKDVAKNFGLRLVFAFYNILRTVKEFTVLIAVILGVLLLLFATWLDNTAYTEQVKIRQPLIGTDNFIDDVVDGLNFLTQQLPNKASSFVNTTLFTMQDVANAFGSNTVNKMLLPLNGMIEGIQDTTNDVVRWAYRQIGKSNPPQITIDQVTANIPSLSPNWIPTLQHINLSEIEIPSRKFSVDRELYPFVVKVFDIPRTAAYYATWIGGIMLAYAGLRVFIAFISPFIPRTEILCCGKSFTKCLELTGRAGKGFTVTMAKPWIHVPVTIGICLVLLVVLFLNPNISKLHTEINDPLKVADNATADFIGDVNHLIETLPQKMVDAINSQLEVIESRLQDVMDVTVQTNIFPEINDAITTVNNAINHFLVDILGTGESVYIPTIPLDSIGYNLPAHFMSQIPYIPTDEMLIPLDLVSLQKPISPWVDERISDMRTISANILAVGIGLIVIPGSVAVWAAAKPFVSHMIPKHIKDFFTNPDFYDDDTTEESNIMLNDDENKNRV